MPSNKDRAKWARTGLTAFALCTGQSPMDDGWPEIISDFLADLHHFCQMKDIDFQDCLRRGTGHFEEEKKEGDALR